MQKWMMPTKPTGFVHTKSENPKTHFKEKFVSLYEDIFSGHSLLQSAKDQGIQGRAMLTRFWDELLLLKVNEDFLAQCIIKATEEQLKTELKPVVNELFATCVAYLYDGNFIRVAHALETLAILFREILKKRFIEQGFTIITLVAGSVDNADSFFKRLITTIAGLLTRDDVPVPVKSLALRVYLTILTATDNINANTFASYFFSSNILDALLAALTVKLSVDRKRLELDAVLILIMLLLWRESENIYSTLLAYPTAPLLPLLHTASSLLSFEPNSSGVQAYTPDNLKWHISDGIFGFFGNLFAFGNPAESSGIQERRNSTLTSTKFSCPADDGFSEDWLNKTAGLFLVYFLLYLNPVMKSSQAWPSSNCIAPTVSGQSLASMWSDVFQSFLSLSRETFQHLPKAGAPGILRAKICLYILRCVLEVHVSFEFLSLCDSESFNLKHPPPSGVAGIPYTIPFKSVACVIIDMAVQVISLSPIMPALDPDLLYQAAILVPIFLNHLRSRGWQLTSLSINWIYLWKGLVHVCEWCGNINIFERPGAPELAELVLGIIEYSLGSSQEFLTDLEVTEQLHAIVTSNIKPLEQLADTVASSVSGDSSKIMARSGIQLANIAAIKFHYEVQIASLGVQGQPSYEQALQGVKKKGMANLKLKPRHVGPAHSYTEGTGEIRILNSLARLFIVEKRKQSSQSMPKLEVM